MHDGGVCECLQRRCGRVCKNLLGRLELGRVLGEGVRGLVAREKLLG
jgi:hypothetical protein